VGRRQSKQSILSFEWKAEAKRLEFGRPVCKFIWPQMGKNNNDNWRHNAMPRPIPVCRPMMCTKLKLQQQQQQLSPTPFLLANRLEISLIVSRNTCLPASDGDRRPAASEAWGRMLSVWGLCGSGRAQFSLEEFKWAGLHVGGPKSVAHQREEVRFGGGIRSPLVHLWGRLLVCVSVCLGSRRKCAE